MAASQMADGSRPKSGSLRQRILSAVVLLPVAVAAIWLGGWIFTALMVVAGILMAWEWGRMVHGQPMGRVTVLLATAVVVSAVGAMTLGAGYAVMLAGLFWMIALLAAVVSREPLFWHLLAVPYVCLPIVALVVLRGDPGYGLAAILWLFCAIWATDICAYFTGRSLGGPKLAPRASPNKTWAGLIGGIIGAAAVGLATAKLLGEGSPIVLTVLSGFLAVAGQAGDIGESAIKRRFGYKDSSGIIPGHGGVMDRVDGLVAAAVVAFVLGWLNSDGRSIAHGALVW